MKERNMKWNKTKAAVANLHVWIEITLFVIFHQVHDWLVCLCRTPTTSRSYACDSPIAVYKATILVHIGHKLNHQNNIRELFRLAIYVVVVVFRPVSLINKWWWFMWHSDLFKHNFFSRYCCSFIRSFCSRLWLVFSSPCVPYMFPIFFPHRCLPI